MPLKYTTTITLVHELNLVGHADLAYWTHHLAGTGLAPRNVNGRAELSLGATDLTWLGVRFNESIVVLTLAEPAAPGVAAGGYLVHAFNSSRVLAFMERAFFQTPYYPAAITLRDQPPAHFQVTDAQGGQLRAAAAAPPTGGAPFNDTWEYAVHLPRQRTAPQGHAGYFYARLAGDGLAYPFDPAADTFTLTPSATSPVFHWLHASGFTPAEWRHRPAATHSKSKTYPVSTQ